MIVYEFNEEKNRLLRKERNIDFEQVITAIEQGCVLDIKPHPDQERYPGQEMYIININNYTYIVPFIQNDEKIFLKTVFPSRKAYREYLSNRGNV